jgi:antitoxin (DNA-binding transcriptional repressor) of toxin-antitoxin stability system
MLDEHVLNGEPIAALSNHNSQPRKGKHMNATLNVLEVAEARQDEQLQEQPAEALRELASVELAYVGGGVAMVVFA